MFKRFRNPSILLAALLQVLPICRTAVTSPAAVPTFAIIMRWVLGATATVGAYDAVSGATTVIFNTPTNFSGTVGVYFTNYVSLTNNGTDPGAFFVLTNKTGISAAISNGITTTVSLPPGLTFKCIDKSVSGGRLIAGAIYGTPTAAVTNNWTHFLAGFQSQTPAQTNIWITILPPSTAPPVITNQPVGVTNVVGSNATFSVTAGGAAPLHFQWYFNTNALLQNATNVSLTLTNIQSTNAGIYLVVITNSAGSITSSPAPLVVLSPPVITNSPAGVTNVAGTPASLSVTAGGTGALFYQWYWFGSNSIAGATNSSYALGNLRMSQSGNYTVVITNVAGAVTSSIASVFVTVPSSPGLTSSVAQGNFFRFTFTPVVGLTNSVETNGSVSGNWVALTNIPPPGSPAAITVTDAVNGVRFYRVRINP